MFLMSFPNLTLVGVFLVEKDSKWIMDKWIKFELILDIWDIWGVQIQVVSNLNRRSIQRNSKSHKAKNYWTWFCENRPCWILDWILKI